MPPDCTLEASAEESARLAALDRYDVLDTPPEDSFDRITRIAQSVLNTPIVLVSLVDENRQWFKSKRGLDVSETPREISFCTHAIERNEPLIISDALADQRFCNNPLVTGGPRIRFYAGFPLTTPDGFNIGTLCAIDRKPRTLSKAKIEVMLDLARLTIDNLELQRIAATDSLTGLMSRRSFGLATDREMERAKRYERTAHLIAFDIDHFKSINDTYGHAAGDTVLQILTTLCKPVLRAIDLFARTGGEEFAILLPETDRSGAMEVAERLRRTIAAARISYENHTVKITSSFGVTVFGHASDTVQEALDRADDALYHAKNNGRNRVVFNDTDTDLSKVA